MEYNKEERKELALAHLKAKESVIRNNSSSTILGLAVFALLGFAGIVVPIVSGISLLYGLEFLVLGIAGATGIKIATNHANYKLYKRVIPGLTFKEYKALKRANKFEACVNELNKVELVKAEKEAEEYRSEIGADDNRYDKYIRTAEDKKYDHALLIADLYEKLHSGKELDAIGTDMINKDIDAELFKRQTVENNYTYARKQRALRKSAIRKNGDNLTPDEIEAIDYLK